MSSPRHPADTAHGGPPRSPHTGQHGCWRPLRDGRRSTPCAPCEHHRAHGLLSLLPVTRAAGILKPKSSGIFLESDGKLLRAFQAEAPVMTTWLPCLAIAVSRRLPEDKEAASFYARKTGLFSSSFFKGTPNP